MAASRNAHGMRSLALLCSLLVLVATVEGRARRRSDGDNVGGETCYDTEPKPRDPAALNVHLVCHTHDDVGWLKNVDEYFVGSKQDIYKAGVGYIIDSVVDNLQKNPSRKFTYVEMAFFERWWNEATDDQREAARTLVKNKQLTFANGGWCMHDEAAAHYVGMVDQTTRGHRFLLEAFGYVPRTGWQLDPFGHSASQAYLFGVDLGFDSMVLGRSDHIDLEKRKLEKSMEMSWRPSITFPDKEILTQIRPDGNYQPPPGFCFDYEKCSSEPIQDDARLEGYNVDQRVEEFIQQALLYSDTILGNDILFLMGSDFQWENAHVWYKNLDKLIHYANKDPRVNVFYSTPEDYFAQKRAANISFPVKTDDFFPYSDGWHAYWTGYFTSRPSQKRYVYAMTSLLQSARQMQYFLGSSLKDSDVLNRLEDAVSVLQHHDAITGTAKQAVADDYAKRLYQGSLGATSLLNTGFREIIDKQGGSRLIKAAPQPTSPLVIPQEAGADDVTAGAGADFVQCPLLNVSSCAFTEASSKSGENMQIAVYNNLGQVREDHIHIPIAKDVTSVAVFDGEMNPIHSQVTDFAEGEAMAAPSSSDDLQDLCFPVTVPPKGLSVYYVMFRNIPSNGAVAQKSKVRQVFASEKQAKVAGDNLELGFDGATGLMNKISSLKFGVEVGASIDFLVYNSSSGDGQNSGAYLFRPSGLLPLTNKGQALNLTMVEGEVYSEMRQTFAPWLTLKTRVYKSRDWVDLAWKVGPVPIGDNLGKEISMRISSDVASGKTFYTDSNGREMLERRVDYRPTWDLEVSEPISGNYYPLTSALGIKDGKSEMAVLLDRPCGGSSLNSGDMEFMVHRRILADDGRGVGEPLNETECGCINCNCPGLTVAGTTGLVLAPAAESAGLRRKVQARKESELVVAFRQAPASPERVSPMSGLEGNDFPENVNLMTVHPLDASTVLIRLAHMFQAGESAKYSVPAKVDLSTLFPGKEVTKIDEVSLSANRVLSPSVGKVVTVNPMEIRTFKVTHGAARTFYARKHK